MITLGICEDSKKTREEIKTICKNIGRSEERRVGKEC